MSKIFSIAIDGPSGAGKSTMAKALAKELDIMYLDTGALFRALAYQALEWEVDPTNLAEVAAYLDKIELVIRFENQEQRVLINNKDVTPYIRTEKVSKAASDISVHPLVRNYVLEKERELANRESFILDGRDIGTIVLPHADVKFFLTASAEVRAERRYLELKEKAVDVSYDQVLSDIIKRDHQDASRETAPTKQAEDAILIDSSGFDKAETIELCKKYVYEKLGLQRKDEK